MTQSKVYTIVQFETDDFYQNVLDLVLYNFDSEFIFLKVNNKEEAREMVKKIEKGEVKPDIAVVDTFIGINNDDGKKIAQKLREINPKVKIVGYSIMETSEWADTEIIKSHRDQTKTIVKAFEDLLDMEFKYTGEEDERI